MGAAHSANTQQSQKEKKYKVEKLFRQNNRTNRSRSLDVRNETKEQRPVRPVGSSHSARYSKNRCVRSMDDGANGSISGLTREEKRMIELCWVKCTQKQLRRCSEDIFYDILNQEEDLIQLFGLDSCPISKIRENEFFKSHASNFALVLNLVVCNLQENFEQSCDALQALGFQHAQLKSRGFQTIYWDIFTDCFEKNHPSSFRKTAEREAWSRMILFMLAQMKIGYQRGLAEQKQETRLSVPQLH